MAWLIGRHARGCHVASTGPEFNPSQRQFLEHVIQLLVACHLLGLEPSNLSTKWTWLAALVTGQLFLLVPACTSRYNLSQVACEIPDVLTLG